MFLYYVFMIDFQFLLKDWFGFDVYYEKFGISDFDSEFVNEIIVQGVKFVLDVVVFFNCEGDEEGCMLKDGKIIMFKGFVDVYQEYVVNGWNVMLGIVEYDG